MFLASSCSCLCPIHSGLITYWRVLLFRKKILFFSQIRAQLGLKPLPIDKIISSPVKPRYQYGAKSRVRKDVRLLQFQNLTLVFLDRQTSVHVMLPSLSGLVFWGKWSFSLTATHAWEISGQSIFACLMTPSHYQCLHIVIWNLRNKLQWNLNQNREGSVC